MFESLKSDDALAYRLATEAGRLLGLLRAQASVTAEGAERLRCEGDRRANDFLVDRLGRLRPDDAILSEEGRDDSRRLVARRVWIVDPLEADLVAPAVAGHVEAMGSAGAKAVPILTALGAANGFTMGRAP